MILEYLNVGSAERLVFAKEEEWKVIGQDFGNGGVGSFLVCRVYP